MPKRFTLTVVIDVETANNLRDDAFYDKITKVVESNSGLTVLSYTLKEITSDKVNFYTRKK